MGDFSHGIEIIKKFSNVSEIYKKYIDFAVKFQFRDLETYIEPQKINSDHPQVRRFIDTKLSELEWNRLIKFAKKNFKIICTPFDERSVDRIYEHNFDYIKIASCSMDEWPLLEYIAKKPKKKIICSLGGADESKIIRIVSFFASKKINTKFLYCVAKYPTNRENLNLSYFEYLRSIYKDKILGFSTHEMPDENLTGSLAYAMGARIFEKHIGLSTSKYSLNKYSVSPEKIQVWLENLKNSIIIYGSVKKRLSFLKEENENLAVFKRGAFLKQGLNKKIGDVITIKDVNFYYPSVKNQILANDFSIFKKLILTKKIKNSLALFKTSVKIFDTRKSIEKIRTNVLNQIHRSKIVVENTSKIEISHHYGIENFYKYGMCMITLINSSYCKKILFLQKNQIHPEQFHKKKEETFFILFGKVKLTIRDKKSKKNFILKVGDKVTIKPKQIHSFISVSNGGSIIEELSSKSIKSDSYYLDKSIIKNKNRKSYISLY